ncbi:dockerin type I domain-containing protein, partial [bacterium]|nr:dockerin type I domain-containing protein [bacterium]
YVDARTPDSLLYARLGRELTAENRYVYGTAVGTLGYRVNGELTDWEYGDSAHSRIMAWSLEIGTTGDDFWPPVSRTEYLCDQNLPFCYSLARLAGFAPRLDSLRVVYSGADSARFGVGFRLTNRGYPSNPGPLTVRLESAETRLSLSSKALALPDLPLDSLVRVEPESLAGAFSGKLDRAALSVALYAGDKRVAAWPLTVNRSFTRYYDLDSSGRVDVFDLLALLRRLGRGPAAGADDTLYDLNDDGRVDVFDLLALLRKL